MSTIPKSLDECVHSADFSRYKSEHRAEHEQIRGKLEHQGEKLVGVETTLKSLVTVNRLILGAVVTGIVSLIVILLTRGI